LVGNKVSQRVSNQEGGLSVFSVHNLYTLGNVRVRSNHSGYSGLPEPVSQQTLFGSRVQLVLHSPVHAADNAICTIIPDFAYMPPYERGICQVEHEGLVA